MKILVIPAYNESKTIRNIVETSLKFVDKVIVYDDGSDDSTSEESKKGGAEVLRNSRNFGKGVALKSLFSKAKTLNPEILVTMDGDGQFLPEEIEMLMNPILNDEADVVIGNRFLQKSDIPKFRKFGNKIIGKIANMAEKLPVDDIESGFRAYSRQALEIIDFTSKGFGVDGEILIGCVKRGQRIIEVPITVKYETGGRTSTKNPLSLAGSIVGIFIEIIALKNPLRFLGIPGLILIIVGIIFASITINHFNETRDFPIGPSIVAVGSLSVGTVLLLTSAVLFSIGRILKKLDS